MDPIRSEEVEAFVQSAREATGLPIDAYDVDAFGDSEAMANELAALVAAGQKRATAGLLEAYRSVGEALPEAGALCVVLDGDNRPVCVIRTDEVTIRPFAEVDDAFARDEGEGDGSLAFWREAHRAFFSRSGLPFAEDSSIVCERFTLVYPRPSRAQSDG